MAGQDQVRSLMSLAVDMAGQDQVRSLMNLVAVTAGQDKFISYYLLSVISPYITVNMD
jgi:hypothetical protein